MGEGVQAGSQDDVLSDAAAGLLDDYWRSSTTAPAEGALCLKAENGGESGRGMRIVDALSWRWGYREDGDRTVVWAEFPAP